MICRTGIGLDNIAVAVATELKIPVTNVPDYCIGEVADHALALLLACARNVGFYHLTMNMNECGAVTVTAVGTIRVLYWLKTKNY